MTENPKLVDSESGSNCEFEDDVNGVQQKEIKSDSFVLDMERFEKVINTKSTITLQRNLSRKGSLIRSSEKKIKQNTSNDIRDASMAAISPRGDAFRGGSMLETLELETLGTVNHAINLPLHNQITVVNGMVGNGVVESKYGGKRFSFRRSSSSSWTIDPRRILIFFATLSSVGTILLIYLTISMSKHNVEESALN